jgi:hypothetical protein
MTKGSYRVCILIRSGNGGDICDSHSRNLRIGDVTDAVSGGSDKRFVLRARGGDRLIDGRTGRWNNGPFGAGRRRRGLAETRQPFQILLEFSVFGYEERCVWGASQNRCFESVAYEPLQLNTRTSSIARSSPHDGFEPPSWCRSNHFRHRSTIRDQ